MTARPPSIRDVAQAAGVSTATVSRTLSSPDVVSEATRQSVFKAIRETGYTVNVAARNLRKRETGAVAVLAAITVGAARVTRKSAHAVDRCGITAPPTWPRVAPGVPDRLRATP